MDSHRIFRQSPVNRRRIIQAAAAATIAGLTPPRLVQADEHDVSSSGPDVASGRATRFRHACMTLPYSEFPLERAIQGIQSAGYDAIAWGVSHRENGAEKQPVLAEDAAVSDAKQLASRCRDAGLEPVMMFSTVYPEDDRAVPIFRQRIQQASAAGIPQLLTFGHTEGGKSELWVKRFRELAPMAGDHGVMIVIKQHGGSTGTGAACAKIVREIDSPHVAVNYDAGNVMDYLDLDPIADVQSCTQEIRSFCIKDHRNWPRDQDCGPGFGEIDHYRLFEPFAFAGREILLAYENIFSPLLPRPSDPADIDRLARRAREYLQTVISGLQSLS